METVSVLKIEIGNWGSAMEENQFEESARMLERMAHRIRENERWPSSATSWGVFDINGNAVGHAITINRRVP